MRKLLANIREGDRVTGWEGSEGEIRAMREHLEDMRTLAMKLGKTHK